MPTVSPDVEAGRKITTGISFASFKGKLGEHKARVLKREGRACELWALICVLLIVFVVLVLTKTIQF